MSRFYARVQRDWEARAAGVVPAEPRMRARSAEDDEKRMRALPVIGRGVSGAIPGTKPGANLR